jgi:hypothetical protein
MFYKENISAKQTYCRKENKQYEKTKLLNKTNLKTGGTDF